MNAQERERAVALYAAQFEPEPRPWRQLILTAFTVLFVASGYGIAVAVATRAPETPAACHTAVVLANEVFETDVDLSNAITDRNALTGTEYARANGKVSRLMADLNDYVQDYQEARDECLRTTP